LQKSQPALGLFEKCAYETSEIRLSAGDLLMLFTDGVFEVHSAQDEMFSQDRLATTVTRHRELPAPQLFDCVLREIRDFAANNEFDDDVCLVGMEYSAAAQGKVG
jgi:serine phosphatase RsbU (regulator of sigma subunit)